LLLLGRLVGGVQILLSSILRSTILKPDLDLPFGQTDRSRNVRLLLGRDVRIGDVLLLQLQLLSLLVHRPVFLASSRLAYKLHSQPAATYTEAKKYMHTMLLGRW